MGKSNSKKSKNRGKLVLLCLMVIFIIICVVVFANRDNKENNNINNGSKTAFETYVQNNLINSDFLEFVSLSSGLTDKNQKIEFCINRIMNVNKVSNVSIQEIYNYYVKIFGKDDDIENFLNMDLLINFKLNKDSNEYIKSDNYIEKKVDTVNGFKLESFKNENGKIFATFKTIEPKNVLEFLSYFVKKLDVENSDEVRNIMDKLNEIAVKSSNLTKDDNDYLLTLAQKDIDALAYVSRFYVLFNVNGDNFIIEDIKR